MRLVDFEILQGSFSLRAPILVCFDVNLAKSICFNSGGLHYRSCISMISQRPIDCIGISSMRSFTHHVRVLLRILIPEARSMNVREIFGCISPQ